MLGFSSFSETALNSLPSNAFQVTANNGVYTFVGQSAVLQKSTAFTLQAQAGAYTLTGQYADLTYSVNNVLVAQPGAYTLSGQYATLDYQATTGNYVLSAENGVYAINGQSANITYQSATTSAQSGVRRAILAELQREALKKWEPKVEELKVEEVPVVKKKIKTVVKEVFDEEKASRERRRQHDLAVSQLVAPQDTLQIDEILLLTKREINVLYVEFNRTLIKQQYEAEQDDEEAILLLLAEAA